MFPLIPFENTCKLNFAVEHFETQSGGFSIANPKGAARSMGIKKKNPPSDQLGGFHFMLFPFLGHSATITGLLKQLL